MTTIKYAVQRTDGAFMTPRFGLHAPRFGPLDQVNLYQDERRATWAANWCTDRGHDVRVVPVTLTAED